MGRKRSKKKTDEELGPPPDPMPLTDPRDGVSTRYENLHCTLRTRLVGRCSGCSSQRHTVEHVVDSESGYYKGWMCDNCCPVCVQNLHVEYDLEKVTEIIAKAWKMFPEVPVERMPSQSEMLLIDTIKRR